MKDKKLSENSTFYHYTLIKKAIYTPAFIMVCICFNFFFLICDIAYFKLEGLETFVLAIPIVCLLQIILIKIVLRTIQDASRRFWSIRFNFPCIGYLPTGFVSLKSLHRVHAHLLLVGTAVIAVSYAWVPSSYFNSFIFVHLCLLLPRYIILWKFKKLKPSGFVKFNDNDASYYIS